MAHDSIKADGILAIPNGRGPISCKCSTHLMNPMQESTPSIATALEGEFRFTCIEWRIEP